jgi:hypothetical protein
VLGELRGPEAEPIVVLGGQDEQLDAGVFEHSRPLAGVKVGRVEQRWVFLALTPLAVGEGVHAKMGKGDELVPLPGQLLRAGQREGLCGQSHGGGEAECAEQQSEDSERLIGGNWFLHSEPELTGAKPGEQERRRMDAR